MKKVIVKFDFVNSRANHTISLGTVSLPMAYKSLLLSLIKILAFFK